MPRTTRSKGGLATRVGLGCVMVGVLLAVCPAASLAEGQSQPVASESALESSVGSDAWFEQQLAAIDRKDADGLHRLAMTCWTKKRPDLTAEVCRLILDSWPNHARAKALLRLSSQHLAARSMIHPTSQPVASQPAISLPASQITASVLTSVGMNRLRLGEFAFKDMTDRPKVVVPSAVAQEFLAEVDRAELMTAREKDQFRGSDSDDKLRWIVLHTGMRFADRVQVNTEPRSLLTYRQKIWPIISQGCASMACHGGDRAGLLRLVLPATLPAVGATNFYTLSVFKGEEGRLIDREHPQASLLLQYGLPPDQAELKHPVPIRPLYEMGTKDAKYRVVLEWIRALRAPEVDYGITESMWQPLSIKAPSSVEPVQPAVSR